MELMADILAEGRELARSRLEAYPGGMSPDEAF